MDGYSRSLELARWAEEEGLAAFAVADHYLAGPDDPYALDQLTLLGAIAAHTDRIELSTLVSPITFRHPAVMLKAAVTLDEISGGRFTLGVGAGWMEEEHELFGFPFPTMGERFEILTEALGYITAGLSGATGFAGSHYRLAPETTPRPSGTNVRLVVGGSGAEKTPRLAGTYAHEFNAFPSADAYGPRIARAREAAAEAGRDPGELLISTAFPLIVGADEAEVAARIAPVAERRGAEAADIRTRWGGMGIPVGTVGQVLSRLEEMAAEGVRRVYFQVSGEPLEEIKRSVRLLID